MNKLLRRIFGLTRDENEEWKRLQNDVLHRLIHLIKTRILRWAGHVARMEKGRSTLKILTVKRLGRPRHRWEYDIRMDLKEMCVNTRDWADSALRRGYWRPLVNAALILWVPKSIELVKVY